MVLWDPRCAASIGVVSAPGGDWQPRGRSARPTCATVQLDDWKLVAAFNQGNADGDSAGIGASVSQSSAATVALYDMRAVPAAAAAGASSSLAASWAQPLQVHQASGRVNSLKV